MPNLFDELAARIERDPRLTRRGGPRADMGLLLFNARAELRALWAAAERCTHTTDGLAGVPELDELRRAVDALRPILGERHAPQ